MINIAQTITQMEEMKSSLDVAINALRSVQATVSGNPAISGGLSRAVPTGVPGSIKPKRQLTEEARRKISEGQRRRRERAAQIAASQAPTPEPGIPATVANAAGAGAAPEAPTEPAIVVDEPTSAPTATETRAGKGRRGVQ